MKPHRVQLSRRKGFRLPANTISVARPSKWGNPFVVQFDPHPDYSPQNSAEAVALFRQHVLALIQNGTGYPLAELRGKNLACWCPLVDVEGLPFPCHADVLLELANK